MKFTTLLNSLLLLLLLSSASTAKEAAGVMDNFDAKKIAEHTWVVLGPLEQPNAENKGFMNNPAFVITEKSVIVLDPGSTVHVGRALLKKIRKLTDKPITHVFISHIHGDHWLGSQAIAEENPKVKIFAHPEMIKEAKAGEAEKWIDLMITLTEGAAEGTKVVYPTEALTDGQEIKVDNITIKTHLSEIAHTKTDAMFVIVEDKVLVTGDNAFSNRSPRLDDGSFVGNIAAMDSALKLDIDVVIPGHGPNGGKEVLSGYRDFIATIFDTTVELMEDDMEAFEMKPIIIKKMEKFKDWGNFDGAIGKLISIAVLEAENL